MAIMNDGAKIVFSVRIVVFCEFGVIGDVLHDCTDSGFTKRGDTVCHDHFPTDEGTAELVVELPNAWLVYAG